MNRRRFLGALAAALAGATLDPEKLLWVPGQKTLFVPPAAGWGVETTDDWIRRFIREAAAQLAHDIDRNALELLAKSDPLTAANALQFGHYARRPYDARIARVG